MVELYQNAVIIGAVSYLYWKYLQPGMIGWYLILSHIVERVIKDIETDTLDDEDKLDLACELNKWVKPIGGCIFCTVFWPILIGSLIMATNFYELLLLFSLSQIIIICLAAIKR